MKTNFLLRATGFPATPRELQKTFRGDFQNRDLNRRRKMAALAAAGLADSVLLSLFQMGVLRRLPDVKAAPFDAEKVSSSEKAYTLGMPDSHAANFLYSAVLALSSFGGTDRRARPKWISYVLAGTVLAGNAAALNYLFDMIFRERKVCVYCIAAAAVNFALLPGALRELA